MAADAERALAHAYQFVRGRLNRVAAVAGGAAGEPHRLEPVLHFGVGEQAGDLAVTSPAGVGHRADRRRHRAVVAVAVVAGGRTQIPFSKSPAVYALLPFRILLMSQGLAVILIPGHHFLVRVALGTGLGDVRPIDGRLQVIDRPDSMRLPVLASAVGLVVAGGADGDLRVTLGLDRLAVAAGPIFAQLVGAGRRQVVLHVLDIGVAVAAEFHNLGRFGRFRVILRRRPEAVKTVFRRVGLIDLLSRRIAAVTVGATEPFFPVDVPSQLCLGHVQPQFLSVPEVGVAMTFQALIRLWFRRGGRLLGGRAP